MTFGEKRYNQLQIDFVTPSIIWVGILIFPIVAIAIQGTEGLKSNDTDAFSVEQLTKSLSSKPLHQVQFEEIYVSQFLTTSIKKSGRLIYTPPFRFEKHVTSPLKESFVIDENTVHYNNVSQGITQTFSLQEVPALKVLIRGLRSIFSGDSSTLQQDYLTELQGSSHKWALTMFPLDEEIQESVKFIRLKGLNNTIYEIEIQESNGDHSTLILKEL